MVQFPNEGEIVFQNVADYFTKTLRTVEKLETVDPELVQIFEDVLQDIFSCGLFEQCIIYLCTSP